MSDLAIDSKLRGCDLVSLRVRDVMHADQILPRAMIVQRKRQWPVRFELTEPTRAAVSAWIVIAENYLVPSRVATPPHISMRTKNLWAVQILGWPHHAGSTVRYLGIEVDDALEISEQAEIRPVNCGRT